MPRLKAPNPLICLDDDANLVPLGAICIYICIPRCILGSMVAALSQLGMGLIRLGLIGVRVYYG